MKKVMTFNEKSEIWPNLATVRQTYDSRPNKKFHGQTNLKRPKMANKTKRKSRGQRAFEKAKFQLFGREMAKWQP